MPTRSLALRYAGHRPGASLAYFTGASVSLTPGEEFDVPEAGILIGRDARAELRVASSQVAPRHARIWPVPDGLALEDLGSTNGTSVNGSLVATATLRAGDRLTLAGAFEFDVIDRGG